MQALFCWTRSFSYQDLRLWPLVWLFIFILYLYFDVNILYVMFQYFIIPTFSVLTFLFVKYMLNVSKEG